VATSRRSLPLGDMTGVQDHPDRVILSADGTHRKSDRGRYKLAVQARMTAFPPLVYDLHTTARLSMYQLATKSLVKGGIRSPSLVGSLSRIRQDFSC
jgi:hypothetical protein